MTVGDSFHADLGLSILGSTKLSMVVDMVVAGDEAQRGGSEVIECGATVAFGHHFEHRASI